MSLEIAQYLLVLLERVDVRGGNEASALIKCIEEAKKVVQNNQKQKK